MSFRKNLEYLRKKAKLSQEDLAFKLGVSRQAVSKWESGAAYPETEKIITICSLFDCNLDELIKEDISELRNEETKRYTFNDLVHAIEDLVKRTSEMFSNMSIKSAFRFLFELGILIILILMLRIPFEYITNLGNGIFFAIGGTVGKISLALWRFVIEVVYLISAVVSFVYIYKIRFLDKVDSIIPVEKDKKEEIKKEVKVVKYDFGILSLLGKMILFSIKVFLLFFSALIVFLMFISIVCLVVVISWMFSKVFIFSAILFCLTALLLAVLLLYVIYNFILNRRSKWEKVFIFLLVSILGFGVSVGVGFLEMKEYTFTTKQQGFLVEDRKVESFNMQDDLISAVNYIWGGDIQYVEDEKLSDSVEVTAIYYGDFVKREDVRIEKVNGNQIIATVDRMEIPLSPVYRVFLRGLRDKVVYVDYHNLFDIQRIEIRSSKGNIKKLEKNFIDFRNNL
ncbi:MAG: helix-turn-helix domain-containing protein [Candidatus Dojkabacteria bacterium]